jgi:hypothetical protein
MGAVNHDSPTLLIRYSFSFSVGMLGYDDSRGGQINDIYIHVQVKEAVPYFLSVYFVAKSTEHKHVIMTLDLNSMNVIAPTTLIRNYTRGVWFTIQYHESVRIRLMNMKGLHVSGIAFTTKVIMSRDH